jgi:hypothetical protein
MAALFIFLALAVGIIGLVYDEFGKASDEGQEKPPRR